MEIQNLLDESIFNLEEEFFLDLEDNPVNMLWNMVCGTGCM